MLARLWRSGRPIRDIGELNAFLEQEAAFLSQRSSTEYCRARAGLNWTKLFLEKNFVDALSACVWRSFAAVLTDVLLVTETLLRPYAPPGEEIRLGERLADIGEDILRRHPVPPTVPEGWGPAIENIRSRLRVTSLAAPRAPDDIALTGARTLFSELPIHASLRGHDEEMVINSVRFGMVSFHTKLLERVDAGAVAKALLS